MKLNLTPLNYILSAVLAYQLAALSVQLIPWPSAQLRDNIIQQPVSANDSNNRQQVAAQYPDAAQIAGWHLFGEWSPQAPVVEVVSAPETRLNLRLAGIFYRTESIAEDADSSSEEQAVALALIANNNQPEQVYRVGDSLSGNVTLHQIQADKVILNRAGQLEALSLPRKSQLESQIATAPNPVAITRAQSNGPVPSMINASKIATQLRDKVNADPTALEQLAFATPHMQQGQFSGLRLRPGRNRRLLGQLGLRNGDVLVELNGNRLSDPLQGLTMLQNLFNNERVDVKIVRNGREIPLTFLLTQ